MVVLRISSHPVGHLCAQKKAIEICDKPFFGADLRPAVLSWKALFNLLKTIVISGTF